MSIARAGFGRFSHPRLSGARLLAHAIASLLLAAHDQPTAFSTGIIVDGRKIVGLPNRHYTSIRLPPGTHSVTVDWPPLSGQDDATIQVQINGNEAHFVEVLGTYRFAGIGYHRTYFRVGSGVAEALPEPGRQAVQTCCKFKAPK